jgi:hypothetical protein
MTEHERGFAPTDPSVEDDASAPERRAGEPEGEEPEEVLDQERQPDDEAEQTEDETQPRSPQRSLVRVGWAAVAVIMVVGVLIVVELVRLSNAVNNNGCILRAQANFMEAQGPGVTSAYAALDRLTAQDQLKKCAQ